MGLVGALASDSVTVKLLPFHPFVDSLSIALVRRIRFDGRLPLNTYYKCATLHLHFSLWFGQVQLDARDNHRKLQPAVCAEQFGGQDLSVPAIDIEAGSAPKWGSIVNASSSTIEWTMALTLRNREQINLHLEEIRHILHLLTENSSGHLVVLVTLAWFSVEAKGNPDLFAQQY